MRTDGGCGTQTDIDNQRPTLMAHASEYSTDAYRAHLMDEDAEGPPVDSAVVPLAQNDLGRKVLGRAAQRPVDVSRREVIGEEERKSKKRRQ
jgi:hypothetical protein